jgi:oligopeptidase B
LIPPRAAKKPKTIRNNDETRVDPYFWLRDRDDPEVIAYLEAENAYTAKRMKGTTALQKKLFREIRSRIKETDLDVPVTIDDYSYYARTVRGKQYAIHCRRPERGKGREEILLDENELAAGHEFFSLGLMRVSPDHRLLAYTVDTRGDERYTLRVVDLTSGKLKRDRLEQVDSLAWATDSRTFLYTVLDQAHRPYRIHIHRLGDKHGADALVYHEKDDAVYCSVSLSRSRRFIFLDLHAKTTSEVRFVPADRPEARPRLIQRRKAGLEYGVGHAGEHFYITHNDRATNFKVARAPIKTPGMGHWKTIIAHRKDVLVEGLDLFADFLVVHERERGLPHISIRPHSGKDGHRIRFEEQAYDVGAGRNPTFDTDKLRFTYTSLVTPSSLYEYDMRSRRRRLLKTTPVLGGYRPAKYRTERIWATAPDGVEIPISLVYRKGMRRNGRTPLLLNGYGSYGLSRDPAFSSIRLSLIDRGVTFAIAHIRGGSELGRPWYQHGKFLRKKNTFTDFIACAQHLIAGKYTSPEHFAITGGSAGGLLMGAVLNLRPDLFGVVLAAVPFVDVLNTMLDPSLPLTVTEYDEWGNPEDPKYYRYIKSYSPYENVRPQAYPAMLVTAGLNDPRVGFWEPAKWVAKLRDTKTDTNELLLKTEMGSGHFGASGRYNMFKEIAFEYAYLLTRLGIEPGAPAAGD